MSDDLAQRLMALKPQAAPAKPSEQSLEQRLMALQPSTNEQAAGPVPTKEGVTSELKSLIPTKAQIPELAASTATGIATASKKTPFAAVAVGGAAMGGEIINQVRQAIQGDNPPTSIAEAGKRNAAAFARGAGGELIGRGVNKLFTPFSGGVTPEIQAAKAIAEKEGITVPVSNLTDSKAVQMTERALEYSPFGSAITRQKQAALGQFKNYAERVGEKIGADTQPEVAGALMKEQTLAFKEAFDQTKDKLYNTVMPQLKDAPADTTEVLKALDDIIERRSGVAQPSGLKMVKQWAKQIRSGEIKTFGDLRKFRTNVGARGKFTDPGMAGLNADMSELYAAASGSLDKTASAAGPEIAGALKEADDFFALGKNTLKSKVYKALVSAPQDRMHKIAFVPGSPLQYDMVKEIVGPDIMKDMGGQWYGAITKKATTDGMVSPRKLLTELNRYEGTLAKVAEDFPEVGQSISELKQVATLMSRGRDVATGSQTAPAALGLGALYTSLLYSVGKLFTGNLKEAGIAAAAAGGQAALSGLGVKGITSDIGRKALTTGFPVAGKFASRIAQVGGQLGLQKASE